MTAPPRWPETSVSSNRGVDGSPRLPQAEAWGKSAMPDNFQEHLRPFGSG